MTRKCNNHEEEMLKYCASWVILHAFCRLLIFFSSSKKYFRNTIRMSNSLDPDQARPDLVTNCLQKLAADDITLVDKELKRPPYITIANVIPKQYRYRHHRYCGLGKWESIAIIYTKPCCLFICLKWENVNKPGKAGTFVARAKQYCHVNFPDTDAAH